jgi:membrane-bound serine protease (ClpP class)
MTMRASGLLRRVLRFLVAGGLAAAGLSAARSGQDVPGAAAPADPAAPRSAAPPAPTAAPGYRQASTVAVLTLHEEISGVTLRSLERRVREALRDGAEAIVLDIDTPGGEVFTTLEITHLIRTDCPANTVAWVNSRAYSAGTIIALACREIVVTRDAAFGDSAPINPLVPLPQAERAKQEAPLLAEVVDSARRNHYDENLVKAFVSVGVELWLIENLRTAERVFVDREEYRTVFGEDPPQGLTPLAPPPHLQGRPAVLPLFERLAEVDTGPPPDPQRLAQQLEFQQDLPPARQRLTAADRDRWRPVKQVVSNDQLLVVKPQQAIEYGLATRVISNDEELRAYFGATSLRRYSASWSEGLVAFLTRPLVRGVLLVIFVLCLLIELASPGLGVFGATAAVSLLVLIGAPWLAGMAQWWEILLIAAGLVLVAIELFVLPGFGLPGLAGIACLLVGIVGTFVSSDLGTEEGQSQLASGLVATMTALGTGGVAAWLLFRHLERVPMFSRLILKTEVGPAQAGGEGLLAALTQAAQPLRPGDTGVAETDLRPSGRASFGGRLVDVRSAGAYIERGTPIRVMTVGRFAIEVERA